MFSRGCEVLEDAARLVDPDAVVWKGDLELPLSQQEIKILGVPVGRKEFVEHELDSRATSHAELLEKIPSVKDFAVCFSHSLAFWCVQGEVLHSCCQPRLLTTIRLRRKSAVTTLPLS